MNRLFIFLLLCFIGTKADAQNASASVTEPRRSTVVGDSLYALGNYSKAIEYYKKAEDAEEKIARSYNAIGNTSKALHYYKKALEDSDASLLSQYNYGKLLFKARNYPKADSLFRALVDASPKNPEFLYQLGLIKEKRNDSMYFVHFNHALLLDSEHLNARYKLAKYMAEKRNFNGAMEHVAIGLAANPNSIRFLNLKAIIAFVNKSYHSASAVYEKLLSLQQSNIQLHENLAESYRQTNRFEEAIEQYTVLINEYDDKNPKWHFNIARNYEALRYLDKAQHHFEISILLQDLPLDTSYVALASVYKKQKDYQRQFEALQKAVVENPENREALYFLATAADNYYEDDRLVISYYQKYLDKFGEQSRYSEFTKARIKDLKTEIHMNKEKQ
ncbi:MAG TPA: hypothetical protein DEA82_16465 [Flavobacteriaceae bacterium]|nr:hypothetical protein [Flavobacteriaceae bacterium]